MILMGPFQRERFYTSMIDASSLLLIADQMHMHTECYKYEEPTHPAPSRLNACIKYEPLVIINKYLYANITLDILSENTITQISSPVLSPEALLRFVANNSDSFQKTDEFTH